MIIPEDIVITHKRNKKVVDSRAKGARGEYLVRDLLREHTGLQFERVPMSGACLLYTSPSPRDRTRSRMPSSA